MFSLWSKFTNQSVNCVSVVANKKPDHSKIEFISHFYHFVSLSMCSFNWSVFVISGHWMDQIRNAHVRRFLNNSLFAFQCNEPLTTRETGLVQIGGDASSAVSLSRDTHRRKGRCSWLHTNTDASQLWQCAAFKLKTSDELNIFFDPSPS